MAAAARVLGGVPVRRRVAAMGRSALLAGAQVHPIAVDLDASHALVVGDVMVDDRQHRTDRRGLDDLDDGVGRAFGLRVTSAQVDRQAIATLRDLRVDAHRRIADAVAIEKALRLELAIRHRGQRMAQALFGRREELLDRREHHVDAVLPAQCAQEIGADQRTTDLALDIADQEIGCTRIVGEDTKDAVDPSWKIERDAGLPVPGERPPMSGL